jgi:hypothetical protein
LVEARIDFVLHLIKKACSKFELHTYEPINIPKNFTVIAHNKAIKFEFRLIRAKTSKPVTSFCGRKLFDIFPYSCTNYDNKKTILSKKIKKNSVKPKKYTNNKSV